MKYNSYTVHFKRGKLVFINASCEDNAIILAQAERIKKGLDKEVLLVENN